MAGFPSAPPPVTNKTAAKKEKRQKADDCKCKRSNETYVIGQRRWLHKHPELSWEETETTKHIADELSQMGIQPQFFDDRQLGLFAYIQGDLSDNKKTILLRADIDALPVEEKTNLSYASDNNGVMHACGHDAHTAMLLGAAKILKEMQPYLKGNVKFLFQAAEETAVGAKWFVEHGAVDDVQAVYGCHVHADYPVGTAILHDGSCMPGCDEFRIIIHGKSSHGAMPHQGKDAIVAAAAVVMGLQTLVSRVNNPLLPLVITIGRINGGHQYNILANKVELCGTVRSFSREFRAQVSQLMHEQVNSIAEAYGCTTELEYLPKTGPVVNGDPDFNTIIHRTAEQVFGPENLRDAIYGTYILASVVF